MIGKIFKALIPRKKPSKLIVPGWMINATFNTEEYEERRLYELDTRTKEFRKIDKLQ